MLRKVGAWLLAAAIGIGGAVAMALAGLVALLITDPALSFLAGLPGRLRCWWRSRRRGSWVGFRKPGSYPSHPAGRRWTWLGWGLSGLGMAACAAGIYRLCTMPIHWQ